jgi:hypothetical protein
MFATLMTSAFGAEDPFGELVRLDRIGEEENVRVLPNWIVGALERDLQLNRAMG